VCFSGLHSPSLRFAYCDSNLIVPSRLHDENIPFTSHPSKANGRRGAGASFATFILSIATDLVLHASVSSAWVRPIEQCSLPVGDGLSRSLHCRGRPYITARLAPGPADAHKFNARHLGLLAALPERCHRNQGPEFGTQVVSPPPSPLRCHASGRAANLRRAAGKK